MGTLINLLCSPIAALRADSALSYLFDMSWILFPRPLTLEPLATIFRGVQ